MTTPKSLSPVAASAPGKVLVAGGYLVLDRAYTGLVFGLDARIHVAIEPIQTKSGVSLSEIIVTSPQFREATWEYGYRLTEGGGGIAVYGLRASHDSRQSKNPFIETALTYALTYISSLQPNTPIARSAISILADQAYYSNPGTPLSPTSPFLNFSIPLSSAHKTGLGSSAALVTSFTAAVLSYYLPASLFDLSTDAGRLTLHNLAQAAHCAAQGKVGSGFDIASAVYGSCLYRRFTPSLLSELPAPGSPGFARALTTLVQDEPSSSSSSSSDNPDNKPPKRWDTEIQKARIKMPAGLRLLMCDVDCGSQTPGMVKQVLKWREENKDDADGIWRALQQGNEALADELTHLATTTKTPTTPEKNTNPEKFSTLRAILTTNRALIREMTSKSHVPIEPAPQTALLDACAAVPGVVNGVVPGAGGYDAIVLFVEDREEVIAQLRGVLEAWDGGKTGDGDGNGEEGVKIGKVGILGVREDMVGVRVEDPGRYLF